ncbi:hypothetical protein [Comamonas terrigena]|uniref:hypothetical protein n=1 Tax=Comamonas terrigena TaxID=32013 RepID=UPI000A4C6D72|nr:hypothetical protein [Comamonas terrigena]SUY92347.1 Uncharacterised protein [Comamonas terrigena]
MRLRDLDLPIVNMNWMAAKTRDPWRTISTDVLAAWEVAAARLPSHQLGGCRQLLRMLDALMLLTGTTLPTQISASTFPVFDLRLKQLMGAVFSTHFFHAEAASSRVLARSLTRMRQQLSDFVGAPLTWHIPIAKYDSTEIVSRLVYLVDELEIQKHLVNECSGWVCLRKNRSFAYHHLTPIADKFGYKFANEFFSICEIYHSKRHKSTCFAANALGAFANSLNEPPSVEQLRDPQYTTIFFAQLFQHWITASSAKENGCTLERMVETWRVYISTFFTELIFPSNLIAEPLGGFPSPRNISTSRRDTNIRQAGDGEMYTKLLTQIPLELSDDEAFELIFKRIKNDLNQIKNWAWAEVNRRAELLARRKQLSKLGTPRQICPNLSLPANRGGTTNWSHVNHLANAAATFEQHGYPCSGHDSRLSMLLFPPPRAKWAEELAIPTTGYLIPHCAVIVGEHPSVTTAFLENLKLFDSDGRMIGLKQTDNGYVLIGAKMRRGPDLAMQEIHLNSNSFFAVDQIIQLTEPLRNFLREKKDNNWQYLLINSSKAFGYPTRSKRLSADVSTPHGTQVLAASFASVLGLSDEEAMDLALRFSLSSLRASAATQVYFETRSVQAMSTALGHLKYDVTLLQRYLPSPIRMFFEERWIRIFQTGIIVEALSGSKYQLEASGFSSIEELHLFLTKNVLRLPPKETTSLNTNIDEILDIGSLSSPREAIFGLNTEILTTLISLDLATKSCDRPLQPKAQYWAAVTKELIPYVERAGSYRPDILHFLAEARAKASPKLVERLAYE